MLHRKIEKDEISKQNTENTAFMKARRMKIKNIRELIIYI